MSTTLNTRTAEPVTIGAVTLYCHSFRVQAVNAYHEEPTVSGGNEITHVLRRRTKVTLSGRVFGRGTTFILAMNGMIKGSGGFSIDFGEVRFTGCRIQSFDITDSGDDFIEARVSLLAEGSGTKGG